MTSTTPVRNDAHLPEVLIALDTATHTGWASNWRQRTAPAFGNAGVESGVEDFSVRTKATKTIPADHPGRRFSRFAGWLTGRLMTAKIASNGGRTLIVYEAVVGGSSAGGAVSLVQKGLEAMLLRCACEFEVPVISFAPATIKKWATGSGKLTHESKAQVVDAARSTFPLQELRPHARTAREPWDFDDNQCDALMLLDLATAVLSKGPPLVPDALLRCAHEVIAAKWGRKR